MAGKQRINMRELGKVLPELIQKAVTYNKEVMSQSIMEWPQRYVRAAKQYYPRSPLKRPTGRLFRSISAFVRRGGAVGVALTTSGGTSTVLDGGTLTIGLKSNVEYARVLHDGIDKNVTVPQHTVRRHTVSAHVNRLGHAIQQHERGPFTRGTHQRHMRIKARKFFKIPILTETHAAVNELADVIGWPP